MTEIDVVVIGAGMGGGLAAAALGRAGLSVAVLESGPAMPPVPPRRRGLARLRALLADPRAGIVPGRWPELMLVSDPARPGRRPRALPPVLGHGAGGSSTLYGAALTRLRPEDFDTDRRPGGTGDEVLRNDWPFDAAALAPWYDRAEAVLGLVGGRDPADPLAGAPLPAPPPVCPREANLAADLALNGLSPFRLPVGIRYLPGCAECQGRPCPRGCKADSMGRGLAAAAAAGRVSLRFGLTVRRIGREDGLAVVEAVDAAGQPVRIRARRVVLAAGALNTPRILMRSEALWGAAGPPPLLGAGLMFHISDLFAVFDRRRGALWGPRKTTCLRDFYTVGGAPLGEVQSLGMEAGPSMIAGYLAEEAAAAGLGRLAPLAGLAGLPAGLVAAPLFARAALMATILEDLPLAGNRVLPDPPGAGEGPGPIRLAYRVTGEVMTRARRLRGLVRGAYAPNRVVFLSRPGRPNWGHPLGSCRMGRDPAQSVCDAEGRLWGQPDILVADASLMPSAGGTNPSLTVAALALRQAAMLAGELGAAEPAEIPAG